MKTLKKLLLFFNFVLIALVCLYSSPVEFRTIKIGVWGTMIGYHSEFSVSGRRGIEIAVDELNKTGGIKGRIVELVIKDDSNQVKKSNDIVTEFSEEGIKYVIGPYTSEMMLSAYEHLVGESILFLGPTVSTDLLGGLDDNFIRFITTTRQQAEVINKVAMRSNHKKFAVIYDQNNRGFKDPLFEHFQRILEENQGEIVCSFAYDDLTEETFDKLTTFLNRKVALADAVLVISDAKDLGTIAQEFGKAKITQQLYGTLWSHTSDLIRVGGEHANGVRVVAAIDDELRSARYTWFRKEFERRYGSDITIASIYSYEAMYTLAGALAKAGNALDVEEVKDLIINKNYEGLLGPYRIDVYGDNFRELLMDEVRDNQFKRID